MLDLICLNDPAPDFWQPLPETCEDVVENRPLQRWLVTYFITFSSLLEESEYRFVDYCRVRNRTHMPEIVKFDNLYLR